MKSRPAVADSDALNGIPFAPRHIATLLQIGQDEPVGMSDLAELMQVSLATVSQVVSDLDERAALVRGLSVLAEEFDRAACEPPTTVRGLRVTTPIRTVIDIAPDTTPLELDRIIRDCLARGLFTVEEALARVDKPDMAARAGAHMVRSALPRNDLGT